MMKTWETGGYALGMESIDANHREFVDIACRLATVADEAFAGEFLKLVEHCRLHFGEEGRLMRLHGFPALAEHEGEHHRVLGDLLQFQRQILRGRVRLARAYVRSGLVEWFELHLSTMDNALARHIAVHRTAGTE